MLASYVSATQFVVSGDLTAEFTAGRRIKADCGADGIKYSTVQTSSYSNPNTTVTIDESVLTSNLTDVWYGIINIGAEGSLPEHTHDNTEGQGGQLDYNDLLNRPTIATDFTDLDDTPSNYEEGKLLQSTSSGVAYTEITTFSGTSMHVDGDATVTGTIYAHIYDSYSPLTIKDGGINVIEGDGAGNINFPAGVKSGGIDTNPYYDADKLKLTNTNSFHMGTGVPSSSLGGQNDYYVDESDFNAVYKKDVATYSSNLLTTGNTSSEFFVVSTLLDDNTGTFTGGGASSDDAIPIYTDFGLGNDVAISRIRLRPFASDRCGKVELYGSHNNSAWTKVWELVDLEADTTETFTNTTEYRYYRLDTYRESTNHYLNIYELRGLTALDWSDTGVQFFTTASGGASTFLDLDDTPATYSGIEGNYLRVTASGIQAVDGIILTAPNLSEWVLKVTTSGVLYTEAL